MERKHLQQQYEPASNSIERSSSGPTGDNEFDSKKKMIMEMVELTKQEADVCVFYLESSEWNLAKAFDMFSSMTS